VMAPSTLSGQEQLVTLSETSESMSVQLNIASR
jgi:hypothetical protein